MKNFKNKRLHELLAKRDMNIEKLADQIFSGRSHLVQVLLGQRRGTFTWTKLEKVLEPAEYKAAKDFADAALKRSPDKAARQSAFTEAAA